MTLHMIFYFTCNISINIDNRDIVTMPYLLQDYCDAFLIPDINFREFLQIPVENRVKKESE